MLPTLFLDMDQKMDRNKDGVVTIDEFIETCQKVNEYLIKSENGATC